MKKEERQIYTDNTLDSALFSLAITKPHDTKSLRYTTLGRYLQKKNFETFCKKFEAFINSLDLDNKFFFNKPFYSWLVIEVSKIDGEDYAELSVNDNIYLPIAGKQLACIESDAFKLEMSVAGFCDSLNFILNDNR